MRPKPTSTTFVVVTMFLALFLPRVGQADICPDLDILFADAQSGFQNLRGQLIPPPISSGDVSYYATRSNLFGAECRVRDLQGERLNSSVNGITLKDGAPQQSMTGLPEL